MNKKLPGITIENETEGSVIYNSLPWFVKQKFKQSVKQNMKNNQENTQKYETKKLTLEANTADEGRLVCKRKGIK